MQSYEHHLGDLLYRETDGELIPVATGYNSQHTECVDMLIDDGHAVHAIELKRTGQDAFSVYYDQDDYQKDDIYNLCQFCHEYPRPTYGYIGVRFDARQLALVRLYIDVHDNAEELLKNAVYLCPIESKVTHKVNLRLYKPEAGSWPAKNLDTNDVEHVLDRIAYNEREPVFRDYENQE